MCVCVCAHACMCVCDCVCMYDIILYNGCHGNQSAAHTDTTLNLISIAGHDSQWHHGVAMGARPDVCDRGTPWLQQAGAVMCLVSYGL